MSVGKIAAQTAHASQMAVTMMVTPGLNKYHKDEIDEVTCPDCEGTGTEEFDDNHTGYSMPCKCGDGKIKAEDYFATHKHWSKTLFERERIIEHWTESGYAKICLRADNEEELIGAYTRAKDAGIPCYLVLDEARTELNGKQYTAVAIGPWESSDIDEITGKMRLL